MAEEKGKIWDRTFKDIFQEAPSLFLPLIKEAFDESHRKEDIVPLDNSLYDGDGNLVETDKAFRIGEATYHFECQYDNDDTMSFRMWEYDVKLALRDFKLSAGRTEINFPKSCVVYIARNSSYPEELELKINFQDGQSVIYKVPTIQVQDYGLDEMNRKKLWVFYPFMTLQFAARLKRKKDHLAEQEILDMYKKMISDVETAYADGEISSEDSNVILEAIQETSKHALKNHQNIVEEVNQMAGHILPLKHKEVRRSTELEMLFNMKRAGASEQMIVKVAEMQHIPDKEVNKILVDHQ